MSTDWSDSTLSMPEEDTLPVPKTPKKRAPVKRQASVAFEPSEFIPASHHPLWSKAPSKLSHIPQDLDELMQRVQQLQKRVKSLEEEWLQVLGHLSQQEGSTECITDEEEMN